MILTESIGGRGLRSRSGRQIGAFNLAPSADFSVPAAPRVLTDVEISFDASNSTDPDGDSLTYEWQFPNATKTGKSVTHAFGSVGSQDVTLTVSDGTSSDSITKSFGVETNIIDMWNDGEIPEYTLENAGSGSGEQTSVVYEGSHAFELVQESGGTNAYSMSGLPQYPEAGDKFQFVTQNSGENSVFEFARQDDSGANQNGYRALLKTGTDSLLEVSHIDGGNIDKRDSVSINASSDTWYITVVSWHTDGLIELTAFDQSDNELGTVSIQDEQYKSGGIGPTGAGPDGSVYRYDAAKIIGYVG